jgi:hypothetical protein
VLTEVVASHATVRSASLIAPTGNLRRFRVREGVNLLLNHHEMGELVRAANKAAATFYRFAPKMGELRQMQLDFENLHALIFPMPDRNVLLVTVERTEKNVEKMAASIMRLLEREGMVPAPPSQ